MANELRFAIDAPGGQPARGGLLPVANVIQNSEPRITATGVAYQGELCGHSRRVPTDGSEKIADDVPVVDGAPFSVYRLVEVSLLQGEGFATDKARKAFEAGESYGVERAIQETLLNDASTEDITPTPGTPVTNIKHALGLLEQHAADNYLGLPLIHGNRFATSLLPDKESNDDFKLHTINGTPIANGGGYSTVGPGAVNAAAGTAWLYITGQVNIWRDEPTVTPTTDYRRNRSLTLVENTYTATIDCFAAAILVGI